MNGALRIVIGVILAGLAMSLGWGIRGDYGHEAGAMIAVSLSPEAEVRRAQPGAASEASWRLGRAFWIALFMTPIVQYCAARLTVAAHRALLPGSVLRFAETISPN